MTTAMPLGINPLNDFAFLKTFGTPENRESLIDLLNAVLKPKSPIADVTIHNPFNYKDLPKYNTLYSDLGSGDMLGCWLYWLRHAPDYEPDALRTAFPQPALRRASETIIRIAEISEDKAMYDAREKAIRDRKWQLNAARQEGEDKGRIEGERAGLIKGMIEMVRMLQGLLYLPVSDEKELSAMGLEQLGALTAGLQEQLRSRTPA